MHANYLDTLDWGILIAYFLILIGIGIWASLKRKKGSSLFLAERSLKWHHIGFSMWGTNVGPSMLIASASAGFTTGIVSGNYAWYAFVFICLLAFVFAPRYLGARITTLPEFMGRRFGQSTRNILAWYTIVTILISWLALTLFAGGILIRQVFDIPMWQSALILLVISAFFTMAGGLKAVAYTNVFQMLLLIFVSATLTIAGLYKVGGVSALAEAVPADYWNLFRLTMICKNIKSCIFRIIRVKQMNIISIREIFTSLKTVLSIIFILYQIMCLHNNHPLLNTIIQNNIITYTCFFPQKNAPA